MDAFGSVYHSTDASVGCKQFVTLSLLFRDEKVAELLRSRAGLQPEVALVLRLEAPEDPRPLHHEVHRRLLGLKIMIR